MKWNSLHQWKACCWWSQRKRSCPPRIQESHLRGTWSVSHGWRDPSTFLLYLPFPIFWMILSINFLLFFLTFLKDVFTVSVGNLPPNTTAIIKITYVTELAVEGDDVIFTLPNSVAPSKKEKALKVSKFCFWSSFLWFSSDFFFLSFLFFLLDQMWFRLWPKLSMKRSRQIPISWVEDSASRCLLKWPQKSWTSNLPPTHWR